jgi:predicted peptidase
MRRNKSLRFLGTVVLCLAVQGASIAAVFHQETGFLDRAVTVRGVEYRYEVYVPRDYDPKRVWPIILALHGGGDYGSDGIRPTVGALAKAIRLHPDRFPAIVVFAQAHADGTPGWQQAGGEAALAEVDKALIEFHGDSSRIYLTGYSAGGNGAWFLAYHHLNRFAALVVICGFVSDFTGKQSHVFYPAIAPASAPDRFAAIAQQLKSLPIWIFHGDADENVSVEESRHMVAALRAFGANVRYTELAGVDHNAWDPAYDNAEMVTWLLTQRRQ